MGHVLSRISTRSTSLAGADRGLRQAAALLAAGEDERYQAEVMRLAPAEKLDPRAAARGEGEE